MAQKSRESRRKYWTTHSSVCSYCSLIRKLYPACFARAPHCAHLFARSLTSELMGNNLVTSQCALSSPYGATELVKKLATTTTKMTMTTTTTTTTARTTTTTTTTMILIFILDYCQAERKTSIEHRSLLGWNEFNGYGSMDRYNQLPSLQFRSIGSQLYCVKYKSLSIPTQTNIYCT